MYKNPSYDSPRKRARLAEHAETVRSHLSDGPLSWCGCKHCKGQPCSWCEQVRIFGVDSATSN